MSNLVYTKLGLLPRSALEVKDLVSETDNSREIATEWFYNGELVRRDAWVNILRTEGLSGQQAQLA